MEKNLSKLKVTDSEGRREGKREGGREREGGRREESREVREEEWMETREDGTR